VPLVALVGAEASKPSPIRATLEVAPVAHHGNARLVLENAEARPAAGRVIFVLPEGLATEPESQPVRVAPGDRVTLPLVLQNEGGLPPGRYPAFAIFEWADGPTHETALAEAAVEVVAAGELDRARPLLVGLGALGVTLGLFALAWRASRKR
jgi:protein involved in polysaccharide export with SLBB domain